MSVCEKTMNNTFAKNSQCYAVLRKYMSEENIHFAPCIKEDAVNRANRLNLEKSSFSFSAALIEVIDPVMHTFKVVQYVSNLEVAENLFAGVSIIVNCPFQYADETNAQFELRKKGIANNDLTKQLESARCEEFAAESSLS